jgi:hypothetical protein
MCYENIKSVYTELKMYYENKSYKILVWWGCFVNIFSYVLWNDVYAIYSRSAVIIIITIISYKII